ncbi:MAG: site-specific integrase [Roseiarcus sp.]|jgi:integrase
MAAEAAEIVKFRGKYALYWRENGQPRRRSLGTADPAEARQKAAELSQQAADVRRPLVTFEELWEAYRLHLGDRPAARTMRFEAKAVLPHFGDLLAAEINEATCHAYMAKRREEGRKDGAILTELNRVSAALGHGLKHRLIERKPILAFPRAPEPRDIYLTKEQARHFLETVKAPHLRLFVILALVTGARSEAILRLTWDRVDIAGRRIDFRENVGHRPKGRAVVPLNDRAIETLILSKAADCDHVISYHGAPVRSVKKGLARAAAAAGLPGVGPHAFRHSAARWMAESNVAMSQIAQFLGHSSTRVTEKVYARFSPAYLAGAAAALEF